MERVDELRMMGIWRALQTDWQAHLLVIRATPMLALDLVVLQDVEEATSFFLKGSFSFFLLLVKSLSIIFQILYLFFMG
jgi:hypothetical protein